MSEATTRRLTGAAGIGFVALFVVAYLLAGSLPTDDSSGQAILSYVSGNHTRVLASMYVLGLALAIGLCFLTGRRRLLVPADSGLEVLGTLGLVGGVVWVTLTYVAGVFPLALAFRPGGVDPAVARLLWDAFDLAAGATGFATAVNVVPFAVLILVTGRLPRWLGWAGLVVAAAHLVGGGSFMRSGPLSPAVMGGFIAPALYFLWTLGVSAPLVRRGARPVRVAPAASADD